MRFCFCLDIMLEPREDGSLFHCAHMALRAGIRNALLDGARFRAYLYVTGREPKNPQLTRRCPVPDSVFTLRGPAGSGMIAFTSVPV
jgi:hypothetical protein